MKKLGLVGGMGPESTIPYYHDIVYGVQNRIGGNFFPNVTIESVNVFDVLRLCNEQKYDELTDYLMQAIGNLIKSGADFVALSANTPHIVFDRLKEQSTVPLVSIVEATRDETIRLNKRKVGLLGTIFTMTGDFFKKPFYSSNIEIITPTTEEMEYVNGKISSELELGIVKNETLQDFQKIIKRMAEEDGIEAVILGCTELPLLLNDEVSPVPCLDTMKIHIQHLIDRIIEMPEVKFYDNIDDDLLKFAVIISKTNGKWVFCKHRERDTYEVPGGHREGGEDILTAAKRELREETGAVDFDIKPVCVYSVKGKTRVNENVDDESFGMLFIADIFSFEELHSEIESILITEHLVDNWTYPLIQPKLLEEAERRGYL